MTSPTTKVSTRQKRMEKLLQEIRAKQGEWLKLKESLLADCNHENPEDYSWEHDNGYGSQSRNVGLRCKFCGARKQWKTMGRWVSEKEWREND